MQRAARAVAAVVAALLATAVAATGVVAGDPAPRVFYDRAREPVVNFAEPDPPPDAELRVYAAQVRYQEARTRSRPVAASRGASRGQGAAPLACINRYEGSPAYGQHDGDPYSGRYQFDQRTYDGAVTRAGYPEWAGKPSWQSPPHVQDAAARQLYSERGLQPWSKGARANC